MNTCNPFPADVVHATPTSLHVHVYQVQLPVGPHIHVLLSQTVGLLNQCHEIQRTYNIIKTSTIIIT